MTEDKKDDKNKDKKTPKHFTSIVKSHAHLQTLLFLNF